jgi:hypothetical protein
VPHTPLARLTHLSRSFASRSSAQCALFCTHFAVAIIVARDGFFTLQNSGILVRPCDMARLWRYFVYLILIKPTGSVFAVLFRRRTARKMMVGKRTIHGVSDIATKELQKRRSLTSHKSSRRLTVGQLTAKAARSRNEQSSSAADGQESDDFAAVLNLDPARQFRRIANHMPFFTCVVLFQLFAVLPLYEFTPVEAAGSEVVDPANASTYRRQVLPQHLRWTYMDPITAFEVDGQLFTAYHRLRHQGNEPNGASCAVPNFYYGNLTAHRLAAETS